MNAPFRIFIAVLIIAFMAGCAKSGPPLEAIQEFVQRQVGAPIATVEKIERGNVLVSEGQYGPKGTKVFPLRINYSFTSVLGDYVSLQREYFFYKDEFNEWKATHR